MLRTAKSSEHPLSRAATAVLFQNVAIFANVTDGLSDGPDVHSHIAYYESNAEYRHILDISSFPLMLSDMLWWQVGGSTMDGCFALSKPTRAVPQIVDLLDERTPVLVLDRELKQLGWTSSDERIVHSKKNPNAKVFDNHDAHRYRAYFQCLLRLQELWKKNKEIHSRQAVAYYELILRGHDIMGAHLRSAVFLSKSMPNTPKP